MKQFLWLSMYVYQAYEKALAVGAHAIELPQEKPWGQVVAYLRDFNGILIEIASRMS